MKMKNKYGQTIVVDGLPRVSDVRNVTLNDGVMAGKADGMKVSKPFSPTGVWHAAATGSTRR